MMKNRNFTKMVAIAIVVFGFKLNPQTGWCEAFVVKYPAVKVTDTRVYESELLREVLEKTVDEYGPYRIQFSKSFYNPQRAEIELKKGSEVTIDGLTLTSVSMQDEFITIPFPLMKGVLGYRIFLIHQKDQEKFANIKTLDELKQLRIGQGVGWGEVPILKHHGFKVVTGKDYDRLFEMLIAGRFDYFSRGISEALPEYNLHKGRLPDLWIEETILLYYPYPVYYFVNRQHPELAERVQRGLQLMLEDGSFDEFFLKYHDSMLEQAQIKDRKLFTIDNPFLPADVPYDRKELWFDPINYGKE
jgi:ABC-type amino acid transport substrate-binding protein